LGIVVLLGFAIRIAVMLLSRSYEIPGERDHWSFGFETGRIARSLAAGQGFNSPMPEPSGPTAWEPPAYPLALAGIFRVFGVYTTQSAVAAYVLNCLFSALTGIALYQLGGRLFSWEAGMAAAIWLALYPPSVWHAVNTIWDTTLTGLAVVALATWLYGLPARPGNARLAATGLFMGLVSLINSATLLFYPAVALILWKRLRRRGLKGYREIAILTAACLLVAAPWMVRNALQVGVFTPRTGAGASFRLGNNDSAWHLGTGAVDLNLYPSNSASEDRLFHKLGEIGYERYCARLGLEFVRSHPGRFAALTLMRIRNWWLGLSSEWPGNLKLGFPLSALKRASWLLPLPFFALGCIAAWRTRVPTGLLMAVLLLYPIPYYFMTVSERYRFPVEPFLLLVGAHGLIRTWGWLTRRLRNPAKMLRAGLYAHPGAEAHNLLRARPGENKP
jgi:4-amino-4-deoxy-L-arabinose transferase-like glycosyltransferase